jgi:hypothetical protein
MKKKLLVVYYGDIQGYPPTINMINFLMSKGIEITILCRICQNPNDIFFKIPKIIEVSSNIGIEEQMKGSSILKLILYFKFMFNFIKQRIINQSDLLLYDPIALCYYALLKRFFKKRFVWYHNHDIIEKPDKKISLQKFFYYIEQNNIKEIDLLTLPSIERLSFFNRDNPRFKFFLLPNYPSKFFYGRFNFVKKINQNHFRIIFQGSIGEGHGLEQIIPILGWNKQINKNIQLILKGKISDLYKHRLEILAKKYKNEGNIEFHGYSSYLKVPELSSKCHLGIAIFSKDDIMNSTLGSASNKIYEYAAVGLPILYLDVEHFNKYLENYSWALPTDLTEESLLKNIQLVDNQFEVLSNLALQSFNRYFNFEKNADLFYDCLFINHS